MNRSTSLLRGLLTVALAATAATLTTTASAATVNVANATELRTAVESAKAGDEIVLAAGTYAMTDVSCATPGTAATPIVVRAAAPLGARIDFSGVEGFKVTGAYWTFQDLEIHGTCTNDGDCEHAFHVSGAADGFVLRGNKIVDFNAQLKVNANLVGATWTTPNRGLIEYNELFDTRARKVSNPVTKLNIDTGEGWVVRGNYIHDFFREDGSPTYGSFMKSGSKGGLYERNLVICKKDQSSSGTQLGLSFGGGGTGAQYCAPAFDAGVPCDVEHDGGTMRNNVIVNCSDVGIYLNRAKNTKLLHNTLIATSGVDFRFATSSGEARGNVMTDKFHVRDGAQAPTLADNLLDVPAATFDAMYVDPKSGDLRKKGDLSALLGKVATATAGVTDDYCARARTTPFDLGALQHSLGDCTTTRPPVSSGSGDVDAGPGGGSDGGTAGPGNGNGNGGTDPNGTSDGTNGASSSDEGCSASPTSSTPWTLAPFVTLAIGLVATTRRRRGVIAPRR